MVLINKRFGTFYNKKITQVEYRDPYLHIKIILSYDFEKIHMKQRIIGDNF